MVRMSRHMNPALHLQAPQGSGRGMGVSTRNIIELVR